jgi:Flp pilus assembly protein TadD
MLAAFCEAPDECRRLFLLGRFHFDLGNYDKAVDPLMRVADLDRTERTPPQALASVHVGVG